MKTFATCLAAGAIGATLALLTDVTTWVLVLSVAAIVALYWAVAPLVKERRHET